jgi:predicted TIM-barrel fold metal-dependent hydrolase
MSAPPIRDCPGPDAHARARASIAAAPERILWGSDWPHAKRFDPMPSDGDLLGLLAGWVPDEAMRRTILVDNPAQLYGF